MPALPPDAYPPTQPPVTPQVVGGPGGDVTKSANGVYHGGPASLETGDVTLQFKHRAITLPRFIGDYKVLGPLGEGGMGVVVVVQNQFFGREEALKMMHHRLETEKDRDDFMKEMHAQAEMDHAHIVKVNYAGVCKQEGAYRNSLYLVMPRETGDLDAQIKKDGPLAPADAANYVRRLAKAVAHAHEKGVIHCDLKPKNILIGKDGTPKISDFGLAKHLTTARDGTSGTPYGTPSYMPPEQARGEAATAQSDVYGLGGILYELLTGKPPYTGEHRDSILMRVRADDIHPEHLKDADRRIPPRLKAICARCLAKKPADRYATALELEDALDRAVRRYWLLRHWWEVFSTTVMIGVAGLVMWWLYHLYEKPTRAYQAAWKQAEGATDPGEKLAAYTLARYELDALNTLPLIQKSYWTNKHEEVTQKIEYFDAEAKRMAHEKEREDHVKAADGVANEAWNSFQQGRRESAIEKYRKAAKAYDTDRNLPEHRTHWHRDLAVKQSRVLAMAGYLLGLERKIEEADRTLIDAADLVKQYPENRNAALVLAEIHHYRGQTATQVENWRDALIHYKEGLKIREQWVEPGSANSSWATRTRAALEFWGQHGPVDRDAVLALARSYGYLADAQRNDRNEEGARRAYEDAMKFRGYVAERCRDDGEAACYHARDPRNFAEFYDWLDQPEKALNSHREALAYYYHDVAPRLYPNRPPWWLWDTQLPGDFQTDRADSELTAAELLLDLRSRTADDLTAAARHLAAAEREYAGLHKNHPRADLISSLARVSLATARYELAVDRFYHRSDGRVRARKAVAEAKQRLTDIEKTANVKWFATEYYFEAVALALEAELTDIVAERDRLLVLVLDRLETAERKGYPNWHKVKRDVAFSVLRNDPTRGPKFFELLGKNWYNPWQIPQPRAVPGSKP